jgi:outer membrane protein OmpA-like peptidoglycan-associated protein
MKKRYFITESQLNRVVPLLKKEQEKPILEEGVKDFALALSLLVFGISGQQLKAQEVLTNPEILTKVDSVLSDTDKLKKVIDKLEDKKLPNAEELIYQNAENIKATIDYIEKKNKRKTKVVQTTKTYQISDKLSDALKTSRLKSKLKQGYAITGINIIKDTLPTGSSVVVTDTIPYGWSSDNFFKTGTFNLSSDATDSLSIIINDITNNGGKVIGVNIESSTDTEPIKMGNDVLAEKRANSVKEHLMSIGLSNVNYNIETKPDNGPDLYSGQLSTKERKEARIKTSPYRYVKIELVAVFEIEAEPDETAPQVIERHEYELVKVLSHSSTPMRMRYRTGKTKTRCNKVKVNTPKGVKPLECFFDE